VKQHTSPFEQFAEFVHERAAPPWHWPVAVHDEVIPRPSPRRAQHTWVPDSHVAPAHVTPAPLDADPPLDPAPPLDVDPDPLLDAEPPLDPDPDAPLLDPGPPPDEDADPPRPDPELLVEVPPDPPPDPDPLAEASRAVPGIRSPLGSSSSLREHPSTERAAMTESVLMAFIGS
jgi:hypothetical protein